MERNPILLSERKLAAFVIDVLGGIGVPPEDATIVADCLLTANLSGVDSHGVVRLAHYVRRLENGANSGAPANHLYPDRPCVGHPGRGQRLGPCRRLSCRHPCHELGR